MKNRLIQPQCKNLSRVFNCKPTSGLQIIGCPCRKPASVSLGHLQSPAFVRAQLSKNTTCLHCSLYIGRRLLLLAAAWQELWPVPWAAKFGSALGEITCLPPLSFLTLCARYWAVQQSWSYSLLHCVSRALCMQAPASKLHRMQLGERSAHLPAPPWEDHQGPPAHAPPPLRTLLDFAAWLVPSAQRPPGGGGSTSGVGLGHGTRGAERYLETELPALAEATRVLKAWPHADTPHTFQTILFDINTNHLTYDSWDVLG